MLFLQEMLAFQRSHYSIRPWRAKAEVCIQRGACERARGEEEAAAIQKPSRFWTAQVLGDEGAVAFQTVARYSAAGAGRGEGQERLKTCLR